MDLLIPVLAWPLVPLLQSWFSRLLQDLLYSRAFQAERLGLGVLVLTSDLGEYLSIKF